MGRTPVVGFNETGSMSQLVVITTRSGPLFRHQAGGDEIPERDHQVRSKNLILLRIDLSGSTAGDQFVVRNHSHICSTNEGGIKFLFRDLNCTNFFDCQPKTRVID